MSFFFLHFLLSKCCLNKIYKYHRAQIVLYYLYFVHLSKLDHTNITYILELALISHTINKRISLDFFLISAFLHGCHI